MALELKHIAEDSLKRSQTVRLVSESQLHAVSPPFLVHPLTLLPSVHTYETLFSVFVDLMTGCLLRPAVELYVTFSITCDDVISIYSL